MAGLADPGADNLVETPVTADHAASRRPSSAGCHQLRWWVMGNCRRCWLKQDLCLVEGDGETEEAGGFCKLVDDDLEVGLPVRHEGTVVSKQSFQDSLFQSLSWLSVGEGRTGSSRAEVVGILPIQGS